MICYDCKEEAMQGKTRCFKHQALALKNGDKWRERNPEKVKEARQRYYAKHKEKIKAKSREWAAANREKKSQTNKLWAKNNPDRVLNSRMKKFNLTAEEYKNRLAAQDNRCAICRTDKPKSRGRFVVDHDHAEELQGRIVVRGILCNRCNLALGYFEDNIDTMNKAIDYLNNGGFGHKVKAMENNN